MGQTLQVAGTPGPPPELRILQTRLQTRFAEIMAAVAEELEVLWPAMPVDEAEEVSGFPSDVRAQVEALSPEERRELLSRKDSPIYTGEIRVPGQV